VDALWIGRPNERFGVSAGIGNEAVDGELQINHGPEDASFEPV
jgi:hypothetical protein